jgi:thiopurine S-methyltransferase
MDHPFWHNRWENNQIGFHLDQPNPYLIDNACLIESKDNNVFVPLCGKSLDMVWLSQQGWNVTGVEISEIAINDFFSENNLPFKKQGRGLLPAYSSNSIKLFQGDFFNLTSQHLNKCCSFFDRAALIAMPKDMRIQYASHFASIMPARSKGLLVTVSYTPTQSEHPPFSVSQEEVLELYSRFFQVEKLSSHDIMEAYPKARERGLTQIHETVYFLKRKPEKEDYSSL